MRRVLAWLLTFVLCMSVFVTPVQADENGTKGLIWVHNGDESVIGVVKQGDELYFKAEDLAKITGFSYESYEDKDYFFRHQKCLIADKDSLEVELSWYYTGKFSIKTIEMDGDRYYPGSVMLSWMNCDFLEEEGELYALVDAVSLWDFIEQFSVPDFDFASCCQELGLDSKWLKSKSYLEANGFSAVMDLIPMGWGDNLDSYGEYEDYFAIFDGMVQNKESAMYGYGETLKQYAGPVKAGHEMVEYILEKFPDNLDKKLPVAYQGMTAIAKLGFLAEFGVYVQTLQEDNDMKLSILDSVDVNRWNFKDVNSVGLAAFSVADSYRNVTMGIVNRLLIHVADEGVDTLINMVVKGQWLDAVKKSVDFGIASAGEIAKKIDFIDEYEIISNGAYKNYQNLKTSTTKWDLQNWVGQLYLYCYANEQSWRAMASYAENVNEDNLAQRYLDHAETCLSWQGKFLAAYPYLKNAASDYCTDYSADKSAYAAEIREIFARLYFEELDEPIYETSDELAMFDLLTMTCEEIMEAVDNYEILNGFMIGCEVGNAYYHIELDCPQTNDVPDPDSTVTYVSVSNEFDESPICGEYHVGMTLAELLPLFTPNIGLEESMTPEPQIGMMGSGHMEGRCKFAYEGNVYLADFAGIGQDWNCPVYHFSVQLQKDPTAEEKSLLGLK